MARYSLAGVLLAGGAVALVALLVAAGGSHRSKSLARGVPSAQTSPARLPKAAPRAAARPAPAKPGAPPSAVEVRDPQESRSFPAPASVHHRAAAAPATAGEQVVAAGAPSDAEVRQELAQMHAVEHAAHRQQQPQLAPVSGGESIGGKGTIAVPAGVPEVVQKVIAGANVIADFPYVFGGGHASFVDNAYDCSGSVSYALAAGGLLNAPLTSGELEHWGAAGAGRYITVFANPGHTYMYVNGIMYNTSGRSGVYASRWQVGSVNNAGFVARHWPGL